MPYSAASSRCARAIGSSDDEDPFRVSRVGRVVRDDRARGVVGVAVQRRQAAQDLTSRGVDGEALAETCRDRRPTRRRRATCRSSSASIEYGRRPVSSNAVRNADALCSWSGSAAPSMPSPGS